jgi:hypothetical protein
MGASGWKYVVEYGDDLTAVLRRLHLTVFEAHDFYWPANEDGEQTWPTTLNELANAEHLAEEGTHSILDIRWVTNADGPDRPFHVRPLTEPELRRYFGTPTPTVEQFELLYPDDDHSDLATTAPRWSGHCAILHKNGVPEKIAFWGISGD